MLQRTGRGRVAPWGRTAGKVARAVKLGFDPLEGRAVMAASTRADRRHHGARGAGLPGPP